MVSRIRGLEDLLSVPAPVLVLCNARSGSTLLRYLLDTHPDIAAPPESHLGALCAGIRQFAIDLPGAEPAAPGPRPSTGRPDIVASGASLVDGAMREYATSRGKSVWCDKSVATLDHLTAVSEVLPHARYLCLHRHAMDMIASGLEASKWGYARFGFKTYIRARPDSAPAALAQYWIDRTTRMLEFERSGRIPVHRIRYEDLVTDPHRMLTGILRFLELPHEPDLVGRIVAEALRTRHDPGTGDYKIDFSSEVTTSSIGSGRAVPVMLLERRQRRDMNELLRALGYEPVGDDWNTGTGAADLPSAGQERLRTLVARAMASILTPRLATLPAGAPAGVDFEIGYGDHTVETWVTENDRIVRRDDNPEPALYRLRAEVFLELASGALGFGNAVRSNLIRRTKPDDNQEADRAAGHLFGGTGHGSRGSI